MMVFDITAAARQVYGTVWAERSYLLRLAFIPVMVKITCLLFSMNYETHDNIIRLSLFMIPAYFTEGWLLAHWVRYIILGQRWPFRPSGDNKKDMKQLYFRARGILSGMVCFVLINILMAGFFALFLKYIPLGMDPEKASPEVAALGMFMIAISFLAFRYVWFYVPLAVNIKPILYFRKVQRVSSTFPMLALWLMCFVPCMMAMQFLSSMVLETAGDMEAATGITAQDVMVTIIRVIFDTLKNLLCAGGIAFALIEVFKLKKVQD